MIFYSSHVWMWELDYKERWEPKNWCFWTVMLEKTRESLGLQGYPTSPSWRRSILNVHWKDWCWNETPIPWPPDAKNWFIGKDPDAGKDWRQEEKGMTEDEMVGWHHWLNRHEFEWTPGVGDGQGAWRAAIHEVTKSWTRLSDWSELMYNWVTFLYNRK